MLAFSFYNLKMGKKRGRSRKPSSKVETKTIDSEPEEGQIIETDEGSSNSSVNSTPETGNILPQSDQSPFNDTDGSHAATNAQPPKPANVAIGSVATDQQPITDATNAQSPKPNNVAIGSVATDQQPITDAINAQPPKTTNVAIGSIATDQQPITDTVQPSTINTDNADVAIGSVATEQQPITDATNAQLPKPNNVAIGSVATDQQPITDATNAQPPKTTNVAIGGIATDTPPITDTVQPSTINTDNADKLPNDTVPTNKNADALPKAKPNTINKDTDIQQETSIDELPITDATPTYMRVANISSDTTTEDLMTLFGFNGTSYLRDNVRFTLFFEGKGKYRGYAIMRVPTHVRNVVIELNGHKFNDRQLHIEDIRLNSLTQHELEVMSKGSTSRSTSPISGRNKLRPTPNASSRQEESVSTVNGTEDEFEGTLPEKAGGGTNNAPNNPTMAQVLGDKEARSQLEAKRRCQLLIDIHSDNGGAPYPDAHMVYWVLTERLNLSKDSSNGVQAIYAPNPANHWRWCVLFNSENSKSKFEGKTTTYKYNYDNEDYTYTFTTIKTTRESNRLMITIQSSPLISNAELRSYLESYGKVVAIIHKKHEFADYIDSGLRLIFLILHNGVKTRDIPWSLRTSDGIWRKLFFKGKVYKCRDCGSKHSYTEGCPTPQQDEQTQQQHASLQETDSTDTAPVPNNTVTESHNPTNQQNTITKSGPTRTHSQSPKRTNIQTEPDNTTEDKNKNTTEDKNKGEDDTILGTPPSQEVDLPPSPCVVSEITRNISSIDPSVKDRELNNKLRKSMGKIKANQTVTPRRKTKLIEPRQLKAWRT